MLVALLTRAIGTMAAQKLILVILKDLVKRTDNTIDDAAVVLIEEIMTGTAKKKPRKKKNA